MNDNTVSQNSLRAWILAARPKTLTGAAVPVLISGSLAIAQSAGHISWLPFLLCMLFALTMQVDANFVNDYFDFVRGNDDEQRLGPKRACAEGWVTPRAMQLAMAVTTLLACVVGLPLVIFGGWPMVAVGACCVLFCFLYTTTLAQVGMGDVLVLVFFGLLPVTLTYYLSMPQGQQSITPACWIAAFACGLVIDTLLVVNNYRDIDNDRRVGKQTLIVLIGKTRGLRLYLLLGVLAVLLTTALIPLGHRWAPWLPMAVYLPLHVSAYVDMKRIGQGAMLNRVLGKTARNMLVFGLTLSAGFLLSLYLP